MANVILEKGVIYVDVNGKTCSYNLNTGVIIGVSGRQVKQFSTTVKQVLNHEYYENFASEDKQIYKKAWICKAILNNTSLEEIRTYEKIANIFTEEPVRVWNELLYLITHRYISQKVFFEKTVLKIIKTFLEENNHHIVSYNRMMAYIDIERARKVFKDVKCSEETKDFIARGCNYTHGFVDIKSLIKYANNIEYLLEHEYLSDAYTLMYGEKWGEDADYSSQICKHIYDYIKDCEYLGEKPVWKNFLKMRVIANREANLLRDNKEVAPKIKEYQNEYNLKMENDIFEIIVPYSSKDFKDEAMYQQNCLFSYYYPKVKDKSTHVVFIRRKDNIEKPYITCEITNRGKINQYLTRFNNSVTDADALAFKNIYAEYLKEEFCK